MNNTIMYEELTPEQKVSLWHSHERNVNVKACSDTKLENYYNIAFNNDWYDICDQIVNEVYRRYRAQGHAIRTLDELPQGLKDKFLRHVNPQPIQSTYRGFRFTEAFKTSDNDKIKKIILKYVSDNGYVSGSYGYHNNNGTSYRQSPTASAISKILNGYNEQEIDNYIEGIDLTEINQFASNLHPEGNYAEYEQKCLDAWNKDSITKEDISVLASFCSKFIRDQEYRARQQERDRKAAEHQAKVDSEGNVWNGAIGDTVEFTVASAEVKTYIHVQSYYGNDYPMWEIKDTLGRTYTWGDTSSKAEIHAGDVITGKVKALNEFRGIKQTRLTKINIKDNSYKGFRFTEK